MKPLLLLCRHGNTFLKGERAYMVGSGEDLPLTSEGLDQARAVGRVLADAHAVPTRLVCGPLSRTSEFALELAHIVPRCPAPSVDERLCELDYGAWSGLTNEEIRARYGEKELEAWNEHGVWPDSAGFSPSQDDVRGQAESFLAEVSGVAGISVAVTSNGRLRMFGKLCAGTDHDYQGFKVKTGHTSIVSFTGGAWRIVGWNLSPSEISEVLAQHQGSSV